MRLGRRTGGHDLAVSLNAPTPVLEPLYTEASGLLGVNSLAASMACWALAAVCQPDSDHQPVVLSAGRQQSGEQPVRMPLTLAAGCWQAAESAASVSPAPRREEASRGIATHAIEPNRPQRLA
jgi:hypothetical protein